MQDAELPVQAEQGYAKDRSSAGVLEELAHDLMAGDALEDQRRRRLPVFVAADLRLVPKIRTHLTMEVHHETNVKIMVMDAALRNQDRFLGKRTLILTGERYEESTNRQTYNVVEPHRADLRNGRVPRLVDHWRPIHRWPEAEVWKLIERFRINPHPAYWLGWGRVSCAPCIFGSPDQWASLRVVNPAQFAAIADYERRFGKTIDRYLSVHEMADKGTPFPDMDPRHIRAALSRVFTEPVFIDPWKLPRGALLGDMTGPT